MATYRNKLMVWLRSWSLREVLGAIADLLGIVMFSVAILALKWPDKMDHYLLGFFFAIFITNLVLLYVSEINWTLKARYAEAQPPLHDAYHLIRDAWFIIQTKRTAYLDANIQWYESGKSAPAPNLNLQELEIAVILLLEQSVRQLSAAFSQISGVHCRVCVRELICEHPNLGFDGFATTTMFCSERFPARDGSSRTHPIREDSHLFYLFGGPCYRSFFCNNIHTRPGFRLSICEDGQKPDCSSVAAWPIQKYDSNQQTRDVVGYLWVDSAARGAFNERYDFAVGASFADTLYPLLAAWRDFKQTSRLIKISSHESAGRKGLANG